MTYAALSSLKHTLEQLLKPNQRLVCESYIQQHVESVYQSLCALQVFLEDTTKEAKDIEILKVIEKRIRDVVYKAEDRVDSSLRSVILADNGDGPERACRCFYEELLEVEKEVYFLMKGMMLIEFNKHGSKSTEATTTSSSRMCATEHNTVVGMEDDFKTVLDRLTAQTDELTVIPIVALQSKLVQRKFKKSKKATEIVSFNFELQINLDGKCSRCNAMEDKPTSAVPKLIHGLTKLLH
ncbi:hypothetical protein K7X08_006812 [Anisodus acutangulus]|uniref:Uncharacterized protein n=1 Tax=Anisodus acutangulus TaxID=402998 RepID=A0A9Q1MWP8_9SOLA|nr:hypothetical protein K7X08_006812 [Anisodus acutangulus]